ncbi:MAG: hypothetical protein SF162_19920 [bacterium]|nr:hypothetical protein [bacterium]
MAAEDVTTLDEITTCAVHPERETGLRCNNCNRLMCVECAVRTPVGYRCRECVRGGQDKFFKANQADDVIAFAVCFGLSALAVGITSVLPLGIWLSLIVGLPVGAGISEAALRATGRRRSRLMHWIAAAGVVTGGFTGAGVMTVIRLRALIASNIEEIQRSVQGAGLSAQEIAQLLPPITLDLIIGRVIGDISTLLLIGLIAAAVYSRFKMKL